MKSTKEKLLEIHEYMNNPVTFLYVLDFFEQIEKQQNNPSAKTMYDVLNKFYATVEYINNNKLDR